MEKIVTSLQKSAVNSLKFRPSGLPGMLTPLLPSHSPSSRHFRLSRINFKFVGKSHVRNFLDPSITSISRFIGVSKAMVGNPQAVIEEFAVRSAGIFSGMGNVTGR
jgi:hypothetical protein